LQCSPRSCFHNVQIDQMEDRHFFNPFGDVRHTKNRLPHWQQEGAAYFVTFRLAEAIPRRLQDQWQNERAVWLNAHPDPWSGETELEYLKRFSGALERWLDAGHGSCLLRRRDCRAIVDETLHHFDGQRLVLISFVVMPNHVHVLFVQNAEWPLEKIIRSWKSFPARRINERLERSGNLWQRDYFDRLVRDQKHFAKCVRYIRRNPEKARLRKGEYILYESDLARTVE
jgi:putative transposase